MPKSSDGSRKNWLIAEVKKLIAIFHKKTFGYYIDSDVFLADSVDFADSLDFLADS